MALEWVLFVLLVMVMLINHGVQIYIHFEAYPLLSFVGKNEFGEYLKEYEKRLFVPLMMPYILTVLLNIALIFIRSEIVPVVGVIVLLVLNLSVAGVTVMIATPVYNRIAQSGEAKGANMTKLMQINLLRLGLTTVGSAVLMVILYLVVSGIAN